MERQRNLRLRNAVQLALGISLFSSFIALPVHAEEEEAAELETVRVTGTRLTKLDAETASPVTTITRDDITRTGYDSLGQLIQSMPSTSGSPTNTYVNNGGSGAIRADLRGLGTSRTLVLINGRRSDNAGDLNSIPLAMIERVEILKDGASAIYGADAVAGVINVITRSDFEGYEVAVQHNNWTDGDGPTNRVSFVGGGTTAKGYFMYGVDYVDQDGVTQGEMSDNVIFKADHFVVDDAGFLSQGFVPSYDFSTPVWIGGSSRNLGGWHRLPGVGDLTLDYTYSGGYNGTYTFADGSNPANYHPLGSAAQDYYNYAPVNYLQTPNERLSVFFEGARELTDSVSTYMEGSFQHRRSATLLAPAPYDTSLDPGHEVFVDVDGDGIPESYQGIHADNYYNPFGQHVTRTARRMIETGGRIFERDVESMRVVVGVEGEINHAWAWDASYNLSRTIISDTDFGQLSGARLSNALGPSFDADPGAGLNVVCGDPGVDGVPGTADDNVIAGCVSLNLFGGEGTITQEMLDYISVPLNDVNRSQLAVWNASITGDLFEMGGGVAQIVLGLEGRKEKSSYVPDSSKTMDAVSGNTGDGISGGKDVFSGFAELYLPFLEGRQYAELLDVSLGLRRDDFDAFGGNTSGQLGLRWKPVDSFLVRATYSESFREPTIGDLYSGQQDSFPQADDPCNAANYGGLSADAQARCSSQGVPAGGYTQLDTQLHARVGGNPDLGPEEGESFTFGLGWSPEALPGFAVTLDYWDLQLEGTIDSLNIGTILDGCIRGNIASYCDNISRRATGEIDTVLALQDNLGVMEATGIDLAMSYAHSGWGGDFSHQFLSTYMMDRRTQPFPGAEFIEQDGWFDIQASPIGDSGASFPKVRAIYNVDYTWQNWGASARVEYISSIKDPLSDTADNLVYDVGSIAYLDLTGRYNFDWGMGVEFGITNVTDEEAPYIPNGFNATTDPRTYRMMGTGYFLRVTQSF